MKKNRYEKWIFAGVFLVGICIYSILSINKTYTYVKSEFEKFKEESFNDDRGIKKALKLLNNIDTFLEEKIDSREDYIYETKNTIEMYGRINRLLGKKEIGGFKYAIDKQGVYHDFNLWNIVGIDEERGYAQQLQLLRDKVKENGGKLLYMGFPNKYNEEWSKGYKGIAYGDANSKLDRLLLWNRRYNIDYIDFREALKKSKLSFKDMFYKTDRFWTAHAAFIAFNETIDYMNNRYDAKLDSKGFYRNIDNYTVTRGYDFLGVYGRKEGIKFAKTEVEKFQIIKPKFSGNIVFNDKKGDFEDTVYKNESIEEKNIYVADRYEYYMGGINEEDRIVNLNNKNGLKVLFLRDEFASPLIINMIPLCSKIDCIWGKYATQSLIEKKLKEKYDYVIVGYYTGNITDEFFQFMNIELDNHLKINAKKKEEKKGN